MSSELQEIKNLVTEFEEKLQAIKDKYTDPEPEFEEGDYYWVLDDTGTLRQYRWSGNSYDENLFQIGNVFKSADEAEFMVEKLKVIQELKQMGRPFKVGDQNWSVGLGGDGNILYSCAQRSRQIYGNYYFDSREKLKEAVSKIGEDRIRKYLFGVEE